MIKNHKDMLQYQLQQIVGEKRFNPRITACIIVSLVPQGDLLFAIARYPDVTVTNPDGSQTTTKGGYVGNESGVDESLLILTEILIPTDLDVSLIHSYDLQSLVGKSANVTIIDGYAAQIHINVNTVDARSIPRQTILAARSTNISRSLSDPAASSYLVNQGYDAQTFSGLMNESVKTISPDGSILIYGNTADWSRQSIEDTQGDSSYKDISKTAPISAVTGLPTQQLNQVVCFSVPSFFAGF